MSIKRLNNGLVLMNIINIKQNLQEKWFPKFRCVKMAKCITFSFLYPLFCFLSKNIELQDTTY